MGADDEHQSVTLDPAAPPAFSSRRRVTAGMRLGRYEILAPIASGGMGEVHVARDTSLGRKVAIKVLDAGGGRDADEGLRRFEHEARVVAALNHPNILAVFDVGVFETTAYIVFELLEGETLRRRLARGPLAPAEALTFGVQIARGLAAAHDKGIIHRDLKPENVFITAGRSEIKVLDFGLAKLHKPAFGDAPSSLAGLPTDSGLFVGTVIYMSPEQARSQSVDLRTDLFSLGVVLYEMVTGRHPFQAGSVADTLSNILSREPAPLPELHASLEPVVQRCLRKLPAERFQTAADLVFTLEWIAGGAPAPVAPVVSRVSAEDATPRVLVVDDDRMMQMLLRRNLTQAGYEVDTAPDGPTALARLRESAYDLIILDFVMPTMDGYEVLGRITADEQLRSIPVVLVSGIDDKANAALMVEAGAADYLTKPVDGGLLRARAARCIAAKRARDREQRLLVEVKAANAKLRESEERRERLIDDLRELLASCETDLDLRAALDALLSAP